MAKIDFKLKQSVTFELDDRFHFSNKERDKIISEMRTQINNNFRMNEAKEIKSAEYASRFVTNVGGF